jgi:hypothetical protein
VLHALLTLLFVHLAALALTNRQTAALRAGSSPWLLLLSPILVMTRYESAFLILTVSVLFAFQRRWRMSLGLLGGAGAAIALYGWIAVAHGWLAIPNSIRFKANLGHGSGILGYLHLATHWVSASIDAPHLVALFLFALMLLFAAYRQHRTLWTYAGVFLIQFLAVCAMHLDLARTGWFYRYEAYLIVLAIVACAIALHDLAAVRGSLVMRLGYVFAALALALLGYKGWHSIVIAPRAIHNIYEQQFQMARFVGQYYPHDTIVLNDIGAICYYTDAHVLDVFGLGSMEPATAKLARNYNTAWLRGWAAQEGATLAILYPQGWFGEWFAIPPDWPKVGSWSVSDRLVLGGASVAIFAIRPGSAPALSSSVREFGKELPPEVIQSGVNVEKASLRFRLPE